jgi:hypothetical protein
MSGVGFGITMTKGDANGMRITGTTMWKRNTMMIIIKNKISPHTPKCNREGKVFIDFFTNFEFSNKN